MAEKQKKQDKPVKKPVAPPRKVDPKLCHVTQGKGERKTGGKAVKFED